MLLNFNPMFASKTFYAQRGNMSNRRNLDLNNHFDFHALIYSVPLSSFTSNVLNVEV